MDISNYSSVQAVFFQSGIFHAKLISGRRDKTFLDMSLHSEVVNSRVFRSYLVRMCLDPHTPPEKAFRGSKLTPPNPRYDWRMAWKTRVTSSEVILFTYQSEGQYDVFFPWEPTFP